MKRKVIQLAGKTLVVSLPINWVKLNNVFKGDEIEVQEKGPTITFSTEKHISKEKTSVDVSNIAPMAKRIVASAYKAGFDEVEIKYNSSEELKRVQEVLIESCMGYEILSRTKNTINVKNISSIDSSQYSTMMRKSWLTTIQMGELLEEAMKTNNEETFENIILTDLTVNRFTDFCRRIINITNHIVKKPGIEYSIIECLEKIADKYKTTAKYLLKEPTKNNELQKIVKSVNEMLRAFYESYYQINYIKLTEYKTLHEKIFSNINKNLDKFTKKELIVAMELFNLAELLFDINGPIVAKSLN